VIDVVVRERNKDGKVVLTNKHKTCLNLGSYNYLGFADDWQSTCKERVMGSLDTYGT